MEKVMTEKIKPRDKPHYVNNRQFSYAVVDYVTEANAAKEARVREERAVRAAQVKIKLEEGAAKREMTLK